jgi:hypothetical protein
MSKFFSLGMKDLIKAVILTFITVLVTGLYEVIGQGADIFTWVAIKPILVTAALAAASYLIKNLFTNSQGTPLTVEPPKVLKE